MVLMQQKHTKKIDDSISLKRLLAKLSRSEKKPLAGASVAQQDMVILNSYWLR
jgi:hypothetical protein